jgi:translocation and assembly module TamA
MRVTSFLLSILIVLLPVLLSAADSVTIVIEGVQGPALENLKAALRVPPGVVGSDGKLDESLFEQFKKALPSDALDALEPFGYFNAKIQVQSQRREKEILVDVHVEPGPPVQVSSVKVSLEGPGSGEEELQKLIDAFPLKRGDILLSNVYEEGKTRLLSRARNLGYLDANFSTHLIDVYHLTGRADIELTMVTGERYYFGETLFSGAPAYPDPFLRRFLSYKKGEPFSYLKLSQTRTNLDSSERFREASVQGKKEEAEGHEVPVDVTLVPRPEKRLKTGVGYGTDTGARFLARFQDVNILDKGHEFRSDLNISERLLSLSGAYIIPVGNDFRSLAALGLSFVRENTVSYNTTLAALELAREKGLGDHTQGRVFLRLLEERYTIGSERSSSFLVLPGVKLSGQKLDSVVRPRSGYRYGVEVRGTDTFLGSTTGLLQVVPSADLLVPLPARFTVLLRSQGGVTFQHQSFDEVPVTLRFFAGGERSVRGYAYQSLGPRDQAGNVVGGKNLLFGSIELEKAVMENWGVAGFYDAGNAFDSFNYITFAQDVGLGLRYYSKVGPFRLDIARQVGKPSPATRVLFVIGVFL